VSEIKGGLAGPGRRRDPDADPMAALSVVLDEQYHWVRRSAARRRAGALTTAFGVRSTGLVIRHSSFVIRHSVSAARGSF
jgi:hypothetical protein